MSEEEMRNDKISKLITIGNYQCELIKKYAELLIAVNLYAEKLKLNNVSQSNKGEL